MFPWVTRENMGYPRVRDLSVSHPPVEAVRSGLPRRRDRIVGIHGEVKGPLVSRDRRMSEIRRINLTSLPVSFLDHRVVTFSPHDRRTPADPRDRAGDGLGRDVDTARVTFLVDGPLVVVDVDGDEITHFSPFAATPVITTIEDHAHQRHARRYPGRFQCVNLAANPARCRKSVGGGATFGQRRPLVSACPLPSGGRSTDPCCR